MCLTKVIQKFTNPSPIIQDGWKDLYGGNFNYSLKNGTTKVVKDQWLKAKAVSLQASDGTNYDTGFHVYVDENDKHNGAVERVFIRNITCMGLQDGRKCAIAQEIYIPSNPEAWPPSGTGKSDPSGSTVEKLKKSISDKIDEAFGKPSGNA